MIPENPSHYTFFEEIGQGGMGIVYRAINDDNQEEVAIKVLHQELLQDENQIKRFKRESRSQANIQHENAIRFIDVYNQDEQLGLVMELLKGCSLKQYAAHHGPLKLGEIITVSQAILQGLDAAHQQGITHRDIKPSNIFLCDDRSIKIMDFGLAKSSGSQDDITNTGHGPIGSYFFMAPEQILGKEIDPRADLYALGIVLFKLSTSKLPFVGHGGGEFEIMSKQVRQAPPSPLSVNPDMDAALSDIILKLLEKEPNNRYQNCQELSEALSNIGKAKALSLKGSKKIKRFSDLQQQSSQALAQLAEKAAEKKREAEESHILQNTLLWVFQNESPVVESPPPIDLLSPPDISLKTLKRLRSSIATIPPLPEIWYAIQKLLADPMTAASDLAKLVEQDPVLTAHVLKVCNSAAYAVHGSPPVTNIAVGLTRLGMDAAQDIILQMVMPDIAGNKSKKEVQFLTFHAQAIALFCRILADYGQIIERQSAGLFGMLHDIGKLVILHIEDEQTLEQLRTDIAQGTSDLKAEWDLLGYTHIDAGMMLALHWKLPRSIHRFIYFHHHPCLHTPGAWPQDVQPPIMLVHLAHLMLSDMMKDQPIQTIWQQQMRSHVPESKSLMHRPLQLPTNDVSFYKQMQQELKRLELQFPHLLDEEKPKKNPQSTQENKPSAPAKPTNKAPTSAKPKNKVATPNPSENKRPADDWEQEELIEL